MHLASFIFEKRPTDRKDGEKIADFDGTLFRTSEGWEERRGRTPRVHTIRDVQAPGPAPSDREFELVESGRAYLQFRIHEPTGDPSTPFPIGKV